MVTQLFRNGKMWGTPPLKDRYDVVIVGAGGGYTYSASGPTHHAADDLALMTTLPGMTVVAPGDPEEVSQLFPQLIEMNSPAYFRVGRFGEPRYEAEEPPVLGKARLLRDGEQIAILTTGDMAAIALEAPRSARGATGGGGAGCAPNRGDARAKSFWSYNMSRSQCRGNSKGKT